MDRGGRIAQSLKSWLGKITEAFALWRASGSVKRRRRPFFFLKNGVGAAVAVIYLIGIAVYGFARGGHYETLVREQGGLADITLRSLGFGINHIVLRGLKELGEDEIIALAQIPEGASLPLLDPQAVQLHLQSVPIIAEAHVTKLYPDHLLIQIKERVPFALWQRGGEVDVISEDGTVIESLSDRALLRLPHVVGVNANRRVKEFVALLQAIPAAQEFVRAGILVSQRRWNLKLRNGVEVMLPEDEPEQALRHFLTIDQRDSLSKRAVLSIDLRLKDRVTLRLTEEAAGKLNENVQQKIRKWGGRA